MSEKFGPLPRIVVEGNSEWMELDKPKMCPVEIVYPDRTEIQIMMYWEEMDICLFFPKHECKNIITDMHMWMMWVHMGMPGLDQEGK